MTGLDSILQEMFPSPEMASYLAQRPLRRQKVRDAIAYAPVPLERKRELFLQLASGRDTHYFRRQAVKLQLAIQAKKPEPGEFFYLKSYRCFDLDDDDDPVQEETLQPYLCWEHIFEGIQKYLGYLDDDIRERTWFEVEKWSPDGTGRLELDYSYTVIDGEACYFWRGVSSHEEWCEFTTGQDLNLPVPFHPGDLVTVDCRPFVPVSHIVILEVGDNRDCCCLQALHRAGNGVWEIGAVKHGHIFPRYYSPEISPLYRLASFCGQLPENERLLEKVSRYVNGDEERGAALWNHIFQLEGGVTGKRRWVGEAEILSYIEDNSKIERM